MKERVDVKNSMFEIRCVKIGIRYKVWEHDLYWDYALRQRLKWKARNAAKRSEDLQRKACVPPCCGTHLDCFLCRNDAAT